MIDSSIIKLAKSMKKEFIEITNSYIIGTDVNRCTMSIIYTKSDEYYIGTMAELEGKKIPDYWMPNDRLKRDIDILMSNCFKVLDRNIVLLKEDNIKENDSFIYSQSMKSSDGASKYAFGLDFIMYTFSSLHPINKPDTVSMTIYEYDNMSYLAEYKIRKKKYEIIEYIRYLYL